MFVGMKILDIYDPESFGKFMISNQERGKEQDYTSGSTMFAEMSEHTSLYPGYINPSLMYIRPRRKYDQVIQIHLGAA